MAAPSRRNSGFETTANCGVRAWSRMISFDLVAGAHRNSRLGDDDGEAIEVLEAIPSGAA
jgi:hypothetical protein